jgi:CHAT domain-containing protein
MGARTVVAGQWPVADDSTAQWMSVFYRQLYVDKNVMRAARAAAKYVREKFPSAYNWAAFSVFGAGI